MNCYDVLVVGAGISGISAAVHLRQSDPGLTLQILEARDQIGGTWDLFRYPGVRSDSDMYTLGFSFKPWRHEHAIAAGQTIRDYLHETIDEYGLTPLIRTGHKVVSADWDSASARWQVRVRIGESEQSLFCRFLYMGSGYYAYSGGYQPDFEQQERFQGRIVHPQSWPAHLDYAGKKVIVIGSGATAVTLVPAMAESAQHVTMLQRSPTWMISRPARDALALLLGKCLPTAFAYRLIRWRNILLQRLLFNRSRKKPQQVGRWLLDQLRAQVPPDTDLKTHFQPRYNPWEQRLCLVPDSDFFTALSEGRASIVTDHIDHFEADGIRLKSGALLEADIIVTATGLQLEFLSGMPVRVDGEPVIFGERFGYKGMMFEGVPNLINVFGYTNSSWTLRAELVARYACRLLAHMRRHGFSTAIPQPANPGMTPAPWIDLTAGYVSRGVGQFPHQGDREPWLFTQDYLVEKKRFEQGPVDDDMLFERAKSSAVA